MTTNFIRIIFLLYALSFNALAYTNLQASSLSPDQKKTILTVAIEEVGYFPYNYKENGEIKGFSVDILNYIESHSKYDFEFIIIPWPRALYLVSQGKVDLILTLFKSQQRENTYHFIEPFYGYEVNQLFALADNDIEFTGKLPQLIPYSIGTTREYSYGEEFDQASYLTKLPALTEEVLLKLLLGERIDVAITNPLTFKRMISAQKLDHKVKAITPYIALTPVYMALTKARDDSSEIKKTLGQLTEQLKKSSYYQELLDKYKLNFK